jgi:hypothetical protein
VMETQISEMEQQLQSQGAESKRGVGGGPGAVLPRSDSKSTHGAAGSSAVGASSLGDAVVIGNESLAPMLALLRSLRAENQEWRLLATRRLMSSLLAAPLPLPRSLAKTTSCFEARVEGVDGVEEHKEGAVHGGE